jgi:hypothetical protein
MQVDYIEPAQKRESDESRGTFYVSADEEHEEYKTSELLSLADRKIYAVVNPVIE